MAAVPRQVGRYIVCGLIAIIATVSVMLAGEPSAGAAIDSHSTHPRPFPAKRNIRHERLLRAIRDPRPAAPTAEHRTAQGAGTAPRATRPRTIAAPAIGLDAGLMTLGGPSGAAGPDGLSLPVPPLAMAAADAGWYHFTAVPGAAGNAVIAGHVDTYAGPGAFYNLYLLRPGDLIYVDDGDTRQRFDVTSVRELPKPGFPVNQVFGGTTRHMLWLITCGGAFDAETGHYLSNIVVSAAWVPAAKNNRDEKGNAKRSENHEESVGYPR